MTLWTRAYKGASISRVGIHKCSMSKGIVIVVRTILFCVLANVVCGSQHYHWSNAGRRNPRYASCPTCYRDCPDALSALWYPRQSYEEIPSNRKHRGFDGASYGEWVAPSSSLSTLYPRDEYDLSTRSGGANPTNVATSGTGNHYRYRNSFEDQQVRRIDPYLASKPSTSSFGQRNSLNPYPFVPMASSPINPNYDRRNYQPKKFNAKSADLSLNHENSREYNGDRSSRLHENLYNSNKLIGSSNVAKDVAEEDYPRASSSEKFLVVYRADDGDARSFEIEAEDTLPFARSDSVDVLKESGKIASRSKDIDGPFARVHSNSFLERYPSREEELVDSRKPFATSNFIREPEIKSNPYNLSPRLNVAKMMQGVARPPYPDRDENLSTMLWQNDKEWSNEETDKSLESLTRDNDDYVLPIDGELASEFAKESTRDTYEDVSHNENERLLAEHAFQIVGTKGDSVEEASLKFDPDYVEDIENPPIEPTEPTPTNEPTENSMTAKHSQ